MSDSVLWTVNTGHSLGTFQESVTQTIPLPVKISAASLIPAKLFSIIFIWTI